MSHRSLGSKPRRIEVLIRAFRRSRPKPTDPLQMHEQWSLDVLAVAKEQRADNPSFDADRFATDVLGDKQTDAIDAHASTDVDGNR